MTAIGFPIPEDITRIVAAGLERLVRGEVEVCLRAVNEILRRAIFQQVARGDLDR